MLQVSLQPGQAMPLVDQIVSAVRTQIDDRILRPGMRLPPIRRFAAHHAVSRFTVVEAYDRLVALGYLQSRRGSGFYVAQRTVPAGQEHRAPHERAIDIVWLLREGFDERTQGLKVGMGWLPPEWLDEEGLRRNVRSLSRRSDTRLTSYGVPRGYLALRQQLSVKLADAGIRAQPSSIVLTQGATQALDMICRCLLKPGDAVLVDDPGYAMLFGVLRMHGAQPVGVPRTLSGPDPIELEALVKDHKAKVFFTNSVLHNPTSASLSPGNAYQILKLAEKYGFLIVEDDSFADLQPAPTARLATLDQLERVIYVGSFSKTLSANLRVGFLACNPDLAEALTDIKLLSALTTSEFNERLVYLMLVEGHYRKYVERLQGRIAEATTGTLRLLERAGLELYVEPAGGMFAWARVPGLEDAAALADRAAQDGILLAPGKLFRPQMQASPWLRFNVAYSMDRRLARFLDGAL